MRQSGVLAAGVVMMLASLGLAHKSGDAASVSFAAGLILVVMWAWLSGWFESQEGTYRVQGTDPQGEKTIEFEASDSTTARVRAEAMGMRVVSINRVR